MFPELVQRPRPRVKTFNVEAEIEACHTQNKEGCADPIMGRCSLHHEQICIHNNYCVDQSTAYPKIAILAIFAHMRTIKTLHNEHHGQKPVEHALENGAGDEVVGEVLVGESDAVFLGICEEGLLGDFLVEHRKNDYRESRECHVVELVDDWLVQCLPTEGRREAIPELRHHEQDVFVEHVDCQNGVPSVRFPPMEEKKRFQVLELRYRVVRRSRRLHSFQSLNANAYVRFANHINIISSIADSQSDRFSMFIPDHLH